LKNLFEKPLFEKSFLKKPFLKNPFLKNLRKSVPFSEEKGTIEVKGIDT